VDLARILLKKRSTRTAVNHHLLRIRNERKRAAGAHLALAVLSFMSMLYIPILMQYGKRLPL